MEDTASASLKRGIDILADNPLLFVGKSGKKWEKVEQLNPQLNIHTSDCATSLLIPPYFAFLFQTGTNPGSRLSFKLVNFIITEKCWVG